MMISEITVSGLFGCYDHRIELSGEGLTFIHSLNGVGKSTTLRLIYSIFRGDADAVRSVKFASVRITFSDSSVLTVSGEGDAEYMKDGTVRKMGLESTHEIIEVIYLSPDRNMYHIAPNGLSVPSADHYLHEFDAAADSGDMDKEDAVLLVDTLNALYTNKHAYLDERGHLRIMLENEADMMWMTTMNPETRRLIKVMPEDDVLMDLADAFKLFSDSTRVKILYALKTHEMCVCDISVLLGMTKSSVSHQLRILKQSNLVKNRKNGRVVYYSLADEHVETIFSACMEHILE